MGEPPESRRLASFCGEQAYVGRLKKDRSSRRKAATRSYSCWWGDRPATIGIGEKVVAHARYVAIQMVRS